MDAVTKRQYDWLRQEQAELDAANRREGGFLTSDPRCLRWMDIGEQLDEIETREYLDKFEQLHA